METPELLTEAECIAYLRLDTDERNAKERLRSLVRRQRLPMIQRGRLRLFRKSAVDAWLDGQEGRAKRLTDGQEVGSKSRHPAR